jgi:toxin HigB-1
VIRDFADPRAADLFEGRPVRGLPPDIRRRAQRKLVMLASAERLDDLRMPPGNRLEALRGDRAGAHSIRINDQWRICFVWRDGHAHAVEIVDYH